MSGFTLNWNVLLDLFRDDNNFISLISEILIDPILIEGIATDFEKYQNAEEYDEDVTEKLYKEQLETLQSIEDIIRARRKEINETIESAIREDEDKLRNTLILSTILFSLINDRKYDILLKIKCQNGLHSTND